MKSRGLSKNKIIPSLEKNTNQVNKERVKESFKISKIPQVKVYLYISCYKIEFEKKK